MFNQNTGKTCNVCVKRPLELMDLFYYSTMMQSDGGILFSDSSKVALLFGLQ